MQQTWAHPLARYDDPRTLAEILDSTPAMFEVVLDIANLSVPHLIARLRAIRSGIAAEAAFAGLAADLTALDTLIDDLEAEEPELTTRKSAVSTQVAVRDIARGTAEAKAAFIGQRIGQIATTEEQITGANLRIKSAPRQTPRPFQPATFEISAGDVDGEIGGQCDGQPGIVDLYEIEHTTIDPNLPNTVRIPLTPSLKSTLERKDLPSGTKIWARARGTNTSATSPWSDAAFRRVP